MEAKHCSEHGLDGSVVNIIQTSRLVLHHLQFSFPVAAAAIGGGVRRHLHAGEDNRTLVS
jgi:hypothetical protein